MDSVALTPNTLNHRCLCAVCTNFFEIQEDNPQRRRNLHDFCRLIEQSKLPSMNPIKKAELFDLLENKLKQRKLVSLCRECDLMIDSLLRDREATKKYEAVVMNQRDDLHRNLAALQRHNCAITQQFTSLQDTVESASDYHLELIGKLDIASGLNLFRGCLVEIAQERQMNSSGMQFRQLALPASTSSSSSVHASMRPRQPDMSPMPLQPDMSPMPLQPDMSPIPLKPGQLALLPDNEVRKRPRNDGSDVMYGEPSKKLKSTASDGIGGPQKPDFRAGIIQRASKVREGESTSTDLVGVHSSLNYDANRDRLSFRGQNIIIDDEDRSLQCDCGYLIKQNVKFPSRFYHVELNIKRHVLHKHMDIWEYNCAGCGKGFGQRSNLQKHLVGCTGSMFGISVGQGDAIGIEDILGEVNEMVQDGKMQDDGEPDPDENMDVDKGMNVQDEKSGGCNEDEKIDDKDNVDDDEDATGKLEGSA